MRHSIHTTFIAAIAVLAAACTPQPEPASLAAGDWTGELSAPGQSLRLAFHITETDGQLTGTGDSPDRGLWDWNLSDVNLEDETLTFVMPLNTQGLTGAVKTTWDAQTKTWTGEVTGAGQRIPISFTAGTIEPFAIVEGLDGRWEGDMDVGAAQPLTIVFRIKTDDHGTLALMDSPTQMAANIPVNSPVIEGDKVSLTVEQALGTYTGTLAEDGQSMTGEWVQMGQRYALDLTRSELSKDSDAGPNRPQEAATDPHPYTVEEVTFDNTNAGVTLAGTLTLPEGDGPFPAAILVSGSGAQNRNEELMGHKPFLILADHLTRKGVAVLRYDDRGVGGSGGVHQDSTIEDIASDIEAALVYLQLRPEIDNARTGLIGHSEGGMTTPLAATRNPYVAFVVMMAGPAVPGDELLKEQQRQMGAAMGVPELMTVRNNAGVDAIATMNLEDAKAEIAKIYVGMPDEVIATATAQLTNPYIVEFANYDPVPVLKQLKTPVLAINGNKDLQVPAEQNLPALRQIFGGHSDATVIELDNLNHLFQNAETGSVAEYGQIEETFAPVALNTISDWILERFGG